MTCADQTMIRRAPARAWPLAAWGRFAAALRRLARPLVGRVEDLDDRMLRDVGFHDGRLTEDRMRRGLSDGRPFDLLRF